MSKASLKAAPRIKTESRAELKQLRASGVVPGVVYGFGDEATNIQIEETELRPVLKKSFGATVLIDLQVEGESKPVTTVIREVQRHPLTREVLHCDLLKVDMSRTYQVSVPVTLTGESEGVKTFGGVVDQHLRELEIRCRPGDIPEHYVIDITDMMIGDTVRIADIAHGEEEFVTHGEVAVVSVAAPRMLAVEEEEAEEVEGEEVEGEEGDEEAKPEGEEKESESS